MRVKFCNPAVGTSFGRWAGVALIAVCVAVISNQPAQASLELSIDTGSGFALKNSSASGTTVSFAGSQDGIVFDLVAGSSNSPGSFPQAELNITSLKITNSNPIASTVRILVGDTGFTFPPIGPVQLTSSLGGTVTTSVVSSISYQTWLDDSNTQNGMAGVTSGLLFRDTSGVTNGNSIDPLENIVTGNLSNSPFSFTGLVTIDLEAGAEVNFSTSAVAVVPEMASFFVWGGLASIGVLYRRRRS